MTTLRAQAICDLLVEKMEGNSLPFIPEYGFGADARRYQKAVTVTTKIKKDDAIKWAEANGFDVSQLK